MLTIIVPGDEFYDESSENFITVGDVKLELEHSLVSLSKWESLTEKPFLGDKDKTAEDIILYIECMTMTEEFPPEVFTRLSQDNLDRVLAYLDAKMSATWFGEIPGAPKSREIITSELIYYWMTVFNIPFECEHWHLSRLFNLIKICNIKNAKPKKMSRSEQAARQRELNAKRKAQYNTRG